MGPLYTIHVIAGVVSWLLCAAGFSLLTSGKYIGWGYMSVLASVVAGFIAVSFAKEYGSAMKEIGSWSSSN